MQINKCMYQCHTNNLPHSLSNLFTQNNAIHSHETRHRNDPHIIHRITAVAAQCIIHKGPKWWQLIPQSIKNFKNHPYIYILSQNKTKNYTSLLSTYIHLQVNIFKIGCCDLIYISFTISNIFRIHPTPCMIYHNVHVLRLCCGARRVGGCRTGDRVHGYVFGHSLVYIIKVSSFNFSTIM